MNPLRAACALLLTACIAPMTLAAGPAPAPGNRLVYLDTNDPYYPHRLFPRLTTPQWVGEDGVEAVVILAIDDMRGHERWEKYLRPILQRLKKIDGLAPVSIMTCTIDPRDEHLQKWLKEGLSLETHTIDHPCPLLGKGDFKGAKSTYDRCIDLLASVPRSKPVAFRTPCCDSLNTVSPRFYSEIFNSTTPKGNFLRADSSVFTVHTADDPDLPRALVLEPDGRERFRKYLPLERSFVNWIEDYPYPYVIDRLCWQFPCVTPSDWQAQLLHGPCNPATLRDWKAALDAAVIKRGTFSLVFHPYDWMRNEQVVDLVDYAATKYGKKVKFLTFAEAVGRLEKNVLGGHSLRTPEGGDNGVRLLDLDGDGYLDAVIGNGKKETRRWDHRGGKWVLGDFPVRIDPGVRFGVLRPGGQASLLVRGGEQAGGWHFDGTKWVEAKELLAGLELDGKPVLTVKDGKDAGVRLVDLDGDGVCELVAGGPGPKGVFSWSAERKGWCKLPFSLPAGTAVVDAEGRDAGLRFFDIDEDGRLDVLFSDPERYSVHLFTDKEKGWSKATLAGKAATPGALPPFVRGGTDNGAFFHSRQVWWQNENTSHLPALVDRRSFNDLLKAVDPVGKSPEASLRCLKARPGFVVEQVACEPLVEDPIAFAWGPDGKLWVVEMGDYPLGLDGKGKPGGKVKYLEDTDGDGKYDKATVFLDRLPFPTGIMPWRKGVLITCAPDILYAEDTDGDGKADKVEKLYSGFVQGNQQHRVNGLVWGLDNWLYCANGDSGGRVRSKKTGKIVDISGRDLRIRPDTGDIDVQTGQTQYGRNQDDWGNWFGGNNSNPVWHFVLDDRYLRRNPHIAPPPARLSVPAVPGAAPVFPRSRTLPRFNDPGAANRFTSACSPIVYRDELFGPAYAGNTFVSEPVHNLVHREVMLPEGVTFRSKRAPDEKSSEFLASSDNWCRPTMLRTGPDGALWVADMYRAVIEHPQWIPPETQKTLDLRAGHDKGRIYRVYPVGAKPRAIPRLDKLDGEGLVAALDSPSGWQRDMAQMMLLWRGEKKVAPALAKLASSSKRPLARLHALCTLDGLDALTPAVLVKALGDADPGVRRHAIRLCEGRLSGSEELAKALLARLEDTDPFVQLQLAYTLGEWDDPRAARVLGHLALRVNGDRYRTAAVLSSVNSKNLGTVLEGALTGSPPEALLDGLLRLASAFGDDKAVLSALRALGRREKGTYAPWQLDGLASLLDGLARKGQSLGDLARKGASAREAVGELAPAFDLARKQVANEKLPPGERVRAARLVGRGPGGASKEDRAALAGLLDARSPEEVQNEGVEALARLGGADTPRVLLAGWKAYPPGLRKRIIAALLQRPAWIPGVLEAVEKKDVLPSEIDAAQRKLLLEQPDRRLRQRAEKAFAGAVDPDRQKVVNSYLPALKLRGDASRGQMVFERACSSCHKLGDKGNEVGPELGPLAGRPGEYLLEAIFDPNRAVEARYINYVVELRSGKILTGVLLAETSTSITLADSNGKRFTFLRADVESLTSTGKSLMPEGLEKDLKQQEVADLLAYLRGARKPKSLPGNRPEVVRAGREGALELLASNAEVFGPSLVLEEKYRNLGHWSHRDDEASWQVQVVTGGAYEVWLEWACDRANAGNTFVLEAGPQKLERKVASTGTWDVYKKAKVGTLKLEEGTQRVTMRPLGEVRGAMIDLKALRLVPVK